MKAVKFCCGIILFFMISCKNTSELKLVIDPHFFNPQFRNDKIIDGKLFYSLGERYFVFGFDPENHKFDSSMQRLICDKLQGEVNLSMINITFENVGKYAKYHEGDVLSADFTNNIVSIVWNIENPEMLRISWGAYGEEKTIPFVCGSEFILLKNNSPD